MAQFEVDDDVLDNVSGGVEANEVCNCASCIKIDMTKENSCSNCSRNGRCRIK